MWPAGCISSYFAAVLRRHTAVKLFFVCAPVGFSLGHEQSSLLCLISLFLLLSLSHDSLLISMEVKASISFSVFWWWLSSSFKYSSRSLIFKYDFSLEMIKKWLSCKTHIFFLFLLFSPRPDSSSPSDLLVRPRVSTEFERNGRLEGSRWGYLPHVQCVFPSEHRLQFVSVCTIIQFAQSPSPCIGTTLCLLPSGTFECTVASLKPRLWVFFDIMYFFFIFAWHCICELLLLAWHACLFCHSWSSKTAAMCLAPVYIQVNFQRIKIYMWKNPETF